LTLTIDEDVLRAARKLALDRNTSVNQMIREYLAGLVSETTRGQAAAKRLRELIKESQAVVGPITWTRDDLHDRSKW
jgi:Asp-tRNA(Asn)/Glu-tRNA(Gln) amidotransferase B subunit